MSIECSFRSLTSTSSSELLQSQNSLTFKLLKTVADFSQALATLHDRFGHELQMLVETFRKRNGELRKERLNCPNSLFQIWELFLQQVEVNSQQHGDISRDLSQTNGNGLIERVFHRKIQSKKIFAHKERIEAILMKSNELLRKCYKDYCQAYALALNDPAQFMSEYIASHNVYVHQLQATNGMVHAYQTKALPRLLEELEECHLETSQSISSALLGSSQLISEKSMEQANGYENLANACRMANHRQDLVQFVKVAASTASQLAASDDGATGNLNQEQQEKLQAIRYHQFQAANLAALSAESIGHIDSKNMQLVPTFKNEIAPDMSQPPAQQQPQLEKDRLNLEERIEKFEERVESVQRLLARSVESRLNNKVNELQEELCQRRFDLYVAQIHLSAVRSQLQLFEYNFRPTSVAGPAMEFCQQQHQLDASPSGAADQQQGAVATAAGQTSTLGGAILLSGAEQTNRNHDASAAPISSGAGLISVEQNNSGGGGANMGQPPASAATTLSGSSTSLALGKSSRKSPSGGNSSSGSSALSTPLGYRHKWIKAFKSLKETPTPNNQQQQQTDPNEQLQFANQDQQQLSVQPGSNQQSDQNQHCFQEYTFKKIASCDVCKDFLRGHMRQGVKCKLCKISCHNDCQSKAHSTIRCQQPKIKLLRRQKSAGELELNHTDHHDASDSNERTTNSKPDSIYSLIRQVLDAKKRGHHAQQQQHDNSNDYLKPNAQLSLANSHLMNLSTGNLALANQNGKSVSTSALGQRPEASVDRWSIVMDLLAQSRKDNNKDTGGGGGGDNSSKRHSKQLDKFKLAAKSAAAASKHQRYYNQQQQQQQQQQAPLGLASPSAEVASQQAMLQQQHYEIPAAPTAATNELNLHQQQQAYLAPSEHHQHHHPKQPTHSLGPQTHQAIEQQPSQNSSLLIHHTKSLPIGQMPMNQKQQMVGQYAPAADPSSLAMVGHPSGMQVAGRSAAPVGPVTPGTSQPPLPSATGHIQQPLANYQLLSVGAQQLQSTSAPHSPQRKRFNLRMKSFSLDSPESPAINYSAATTVTANSTSTIGAASAAHHQHHHHQQQQQQQQQQQPPQLISNNNSSNSSIHLHGSGETMNQNYPNQMPYYYTSATANQQQQQSGAGPQSSGQPVYPSINSSDFNLQQQQQEPAYDVDSDPMRHAYLSASASFRPSGRHGGQTSSNHQPQHRHSYHNPSTGYEYHTNANNGDNNSLSIDQRQRNQRNYSSSHTALNLSGSSNQPASSSKPPAAGSLSDSTSGGGGGKQTNAAAALDANQTTTLNRRHRQFNQFTNQQAAAAASTPTDNLHNPHQLHHPQQQQQQQQSDPHCSTLDYYDQLNQQHQQAVVSQPVTTNTFVVLYDYVAQRSDEVDLGAGQLVQVLDASERDWWKVCALNGQQANNRSPIGYFPSTYLAQLYQNERPLQVAQTIQVSNGETCEKLLRGQIVIHTGKQLDSRTVTIRTITFEPMNSAGDTGAFGNCHVNHYIQCPEKYLIELIEPMN